MTSLNPVFTIGMQMTESVLAHERVSRKAAFDRSVEMLELVGIPDPPSRMNDYPHQFSGGMRQRVMIAMALSCNPSVLIADEPTTALDVTIQAQILELMLRIKDQRKDAAILLITHNLAVVAETCHRVIVMYGRQNSGNCAGEGAVPKSAASLHARLAGLHCRRWMAIGASGSRQFPATCPAFSICPSDANSRPAARSGSNAAPKSSRPSLRYRPDIGCAAIW